MKVNLGIVKNHRRRFEVEHESFGSCVLVCRYPTAKELEEDTDEAVPSATAARRLGCIIDWEDVVDLEDNPIAYSPAALVSMCRICPEFRIAALRSVAQLFVGQDLGNLKIKSGSGTTAADPTPTPSTQ